MSLTLLAIGASCCLGKCSVQISKSPTGQGYDQNTTQILINTLRRSCWIGSFISLHREQTQIQTQPPKSPWHQHHLGGNVCPHFLTNPTREGSRSQVQQRFWVEQTKPHWSGCSCSAAVVLLSFLLPAMMGCGSEDPKRDPAQSFSRLAVSLLCEPALAKLKPVFSISENRVSLNYCFHKIHRSHLWGITNERSSLKWPVSPKSNIFVTSNAPTWAHIQSPPRTSRIMAEGRGSWCN